MARIRTVKPQHWSDKELAKISLQAHLLWIGMWNFSDDEGIIEADPLLIKSNIFPRRTDVRIEQISQWLDQLVKARFLIPFEYENEGYYIHRTFKTHQKIDRPQPSKIPSEIIRRILNEPSPNVRPCIGEESIVKEGSVETPAPGKQKGWNTKPSETEINLPLPPIKAGAVQQLFKISKNTDLQTTQVESLWLIFKSQNFTGEKYYASANQVYSHFINWCKTQSVSAIQQADKVANNYREQKGLDIMKLVNGD